MVSTFINPVVNPEAKLGTNAFTETGPVILNAGASTAEVEIVIRAAYKQVLGNAHIMESERLLSAESRLSGGEITVRDFVREIAVSDLYRSRFFENCTRTRTIELNFKHLLGRAPESYEEIQAHGQYLEEEGFTAEIDSYIDSDEYLQAFGNDTVPYYRGYKSGPGRPSVGFSNMLQLLRGGPSSDKSPYKNQPRLTQSIMANQPNTVLPVKGASADWLNMVAIPIKKTTPALDKPISTAEDPIRQEQFYRAYQPFKEADKVEFIPGSSDSDAEVVIRAIYRQVMGNAHIMESERLTTLESQFKQGDLSVREFVRALAKSDLYRSRFFDTSYSYRFVELNFKHLLGRAPDNFDETRFHTRILDTEGFEADIDSYIDSDEYQNNFGEDIVPFYRGFRSAPGQSMLEFTNMFELLRSASSSDKAQTKENKPQVVQAIIRNSPYGKFKADNVQDLLAQVFKGALDNAPIPKPDGTYETAGTSAAAESMPPIARRKIDELQQKVDEQAAEIEALKAELAEAKLSAAFGTTQLNKWRPRSY